MSYRTTRAFERRDIVEIPKDIWTDLFTRYAASVIGVSVAEFKKLMRVDWNKAIKESLNTDPSLN